MNGLDKLNITDEQRELVLNSEKLYAQHARIFFRVHECNEKKQAITIKVWQERNQAGEYLSTEELRDRIKDVFNFFPENIRLHIHAREFLAYGIKDVNIDWIKLKMDEYSLKQADLTDYLNVAKSTVSDWLSGNKELTSIHKTMFFYFFKSFQK